MAVRLAANAWDAETTERAGKVQVPRRVIHSSYYRVFSDGNSGDWIGETLSTFPQSKMNIY